MLSTYRWGDKIDGFFPEDLKKYYISVYHIALATNSVFEHDYECSSPTQFRVFHQTAYPLAGVHGLVVSNHLIKEITHPDQKILFNEALIDAHGNTTQCCDCRKHIDPSVEGKWVWGLSIVKDPVKNTSHTLCPR